MCDELTERDNQRWLADKRLRRRELGVLGVGATAAILAASCDSDSDSAESMGDASTAKNSDAGKTGNGGADAGNKTSMGADASATSTADAGKKSPTMDAGSTQDTDAGAGEPVETEASMVNITTPDGTTDAFFVHPTTGAHAAVVMWPDILGLRDAFKTMATQIAERGYAVLVVNQYYRTAKAPVLNSWEEWRSDEGQAKLQPMLAAITPEGISSDSAAFVDWLDDQDAVDTNQKIGTCGYCMGGPFTFRTAASRAERVGVFASLHGAGLVTDAPESPHLLLSKIKAAMLVAIAENDDMRQPEAKTVLMDAAKEAGLEAEIEVYPAQHGFCAIDSAVYDKAQADRARSRMLALFSKHL